MQNTQSQQLQRVYASQNQIDDQQLLNLFDQRDQAMIDMEKIQKKIQQLDLQIPDYLKIKATQILQQINQMNIQYVENSICVACQQQQQVQLNDIQIPCNQQARQDVVQFIHQKLQLIFDTTGGTTQQIDVFVKVANELQQNYNQLRQDFTQWQIQQENEVQSNIQLKTNKFQQNYKNRIQKCKQLQQQLLQLKDKLDQSLESIGLYITEEDKQPISKALYSLLKDLTKQTVNLQEIGNIQDRNAAQLELQQLKRLSKLLVIMFGLNYSILQSTQEQDQLIQQSNKLAIYDDQLIQMYQQAVIDGQNILNTNLFVLEDELQNGIKSVLVTINDIDQTINEINERINLLQQCNTVASQVIQLCQSLRQIQIELLTFTEELKAKQAVLENCDSDDSIQDDVQDAVNRLQNKQTILKQQENQAQNKLNEYLIQYNDLSNAEIFDIIVQQEQSGIMSAVRRVLKIINQK